MEQQSLKVVIVGGSIAGLTLAHCLHRANIDHVVLEKRAEIAPQEGASIGIWPNGARMLEQLGLYGELEKLTEPLNLMHIAFPDGFSFEDLLPTTINQRFGYPIIFLDRQKFLETLYRKYPDKSKIVTNTRVAEVQSSEKCARVITEDGTMYEGDIVVGADGVHSLVRREMWKLGDSKQPGSVPSREKTGMTVEYSCVYGISSPIVGLRAGESVNSYMDGMTVLTFHGKGGRVYWFLIQKLHQKYTYPNTPRYTVEDAERLCTDHRDTTIWKDIRIGHLWDNREVVSMTALEENLFAKWHFHRIGLMGDSIHKMTPNIGQGANSAIEDAAVFSSLLVHMMTSEGPGRPSSARIQRLLHDYQACRYERAEMIYHRSRFGARFQSRDDAVKLIVGRYVVPRIRNRLANISSMLIANGEIIQYLPFPKRSGPGWEKFRNKGEWMPYTPFALFSAILLVQHVVPLLGLTSPLLLAS
uniref:FAD-dependent monooxygenase andE n=1 Tax=Emericella variicolor TaxID=1549217 RepID=ANDE_EMEVA|nr:RecName: Full=FAD-dependent monooxygenase andE; AltName: Full=Anditomin synthesis protein E [Aspergillus stellatus]BAP81859.1 AndE [Aspergillus stellatus]